MGKESQLSQHKPKQKKVTIDGRTLFPSNARASIIIKVCRAQGNLSGMTKAEKNFILDDSAEITKPIRAALKNKKMQLSREQLEKLFQNKRKEAMVTIDGGAQRVSGARARVITKVCDAQGNLKGLTEGEKNFILGDTTSVSTKTNDKKNANNIIAQAKLFPLIFILYSLF